jgi:peroxiredoxin
MSIRVGDRFPDAKLMESKEMGEACPLPPKPIETAEGTRGRRIVMFGLPGAYTPTCSGKHVPGYLNRLAEFGKHGVDEIWCLSVNDGYVMAAWGREQGALGKIRMLGDGNAELTKKLGLEVDLEKSGMGTRLKRCSMFVEDGVLKQLFVEEPGKFEVSDAETMLKYLAKV